MRFDPTRPFQQQLRRKDGSMLYEAFEFGGNVRVSVQAHEGAYSDPREILPDPHDYKAFEVGIFIDGEAYDPKEPGGPFEGLWWGRGWGKEKVAGYVLPHHIKRVLCDVHAAFGFPESAPPEPSPTHVVKTLTPAQAATRVAGEMVLDALVRDLCASWPSFTAMIEDVRRPGNTYRPSLYTKPRSGKALDVLEAKKCEILAEAFDHAMTTLNDPRRAYRGG